MLRFNDLLFIPMYYVLFLVCWYVLQAKFFFHPNSGTFFVIFLLFFLIYEHRILHIERVLPKITFTEIEIRIYIYIIRFSYKLRKSYKCHRIFEQRHLCHIVYCFFFIFLLKRRCKHLE